MKPYQNTNYYKAWRTFYPEGNGHCKPGYVLHHKDPELRHKDIDRYLEWRPEDLVMMTKSDHVKLHMSLNPIKLFGEKNGMFGKKWDDAHLQYFSDIKRGESNPFFGKAFTEEQLLKISNGLKNSEKYKQAMAAHRGKKTGKRWFTNGVDDNIYAAECPDGYRPGRIMFGYTAWNKGMKKND